MGLLLACCQNYIRAIRIQPLPYRRCMSRCLYCCQSLDAALNYHPAGSRKLFLAATGNAG